MSPRPQVAVLEERQFYSDLLIPPLSELVKDVSFKTYRALAELKPVPDGTCLVLFSVPKLNEKELVAIVTQLTADPATTQLRFAFLADTEEPATIMKALELGAQGFMPSSLPLHHVAHALRLVLAGGIFIPAGSFRAMASPQTDYPLVQGQHDALTPAQMRIAKALRRGTPNKLIAYNLNMAESTVKVHVRQIMRKLKARNRTEVAFLTNEYFKSLGE